MTALLILASLCWIHCILSAEVCSTFVWLSLLWKSLGCLVLLCWRPYFLELIKAADLIVTVVGALPSPLRVFQVKCVAAYSIV